MCVCVCPALYPYPAVLGPIAPGTKLWLPLHLAGSDRVQWRPALSDSGGSGGGGAHSRGGAGAGGTSPPG